MPETNQLTTYDGSILLINAMLGAGLIEIPSAFDHLGTIGGTMTLFFSTAITLISLYFLLYASKKKKKAEYSSLCIVIHSFLSNVYDWMNILLCYSSSVAYFVFNVNFIRELINYFPEKEIVKNNFLSLFTIGCFLSIPLYFLSNLKTTDKLKHMSKVVLFAICYVCVLSIVLFFTTPNYDGMEQPVLFSGGFFKGFPIILFSLGCQQLFLGIYAKLENRDNSATAKFLFFGCFGVFSLYFVIGLFLYLAIGANVLSEKNFLKVFLDKNNIFTAAEGLLNLKLKQTLMVISVFAFIVILIGSFSLQTIIARQSLTHALNKWMKDSEKLRFASNSVHFLILLLIVSSGVEAGAIIGLIGSVISPVIGLIIPAWLYLKIQRDWGIMRLVALVVLIFSVVVAIFCTCNAVYAFKLPEKIILIGSENQFKNNTTG